MSFRFISHARSNGRLDDRATRPRAAHAPAHDPPHTRAPGLRSVDSVTRRYPDRPESPWHYFPIIRRIPNCYRCLNRPFMLTIMTPYGYYTTPKVRKNRADVRAAPQT